jgi:hypothetical protein
MHSQVKNTTAEAARAGSAAATTRIATPIQRTGAKQIFRPATATVERAETYAAQAQTQENQTALTDNALLKVIFFVRR